MSDVRARELRPLLTIAAAGSLLSAAVTYYELGVYLPTLNTPHTLLEDVPHRISDVPPGPGLARRLTVVLVDGLSFDVARTLEGFKPLRHQGVFRSIAVEFPSFTSPALVSMVTGLTPRDSGTRRNGDLQGVVGLDTLMDAAGDAGVPVRLLGRGFADQAKILAPPEGSPFFAGLFAPGVEIGRIGLAGAPLPGFDGKSPARAFDWIHWGEVDEVGHRHGSASPQYREEAENAAGFVARYAASLDLDQDVLVVLSDHGHTARGGHGGVEPAVTHAFFLGIGGIFRRGVELGERPMRDIASTLAVLAGVRVPSSNLGLPMLDAMSIGDPETAFLLASPFDESMRFLCTLRYSPRCAEVADVVTALRKPDPLAWEGAVALHDGLMDEREADLRARGASGGGLRLALGALILGVGSAVVAFVMRRRSRSRVATASQLGPPTLSEGARLAILPLALACVYVAFLAWRGYRPSFSNLMPIPVFARDATPAGLVAVLVVGLLAWALRAPRGAAWAVLLGISVPFAMLLLWVGAGTQFPPPNVAGVLVFLLGPLVPTAAVGALFVAALSLRLGRRASTSG